MRRAPALSAIVVIAPLAAACSQVGDRLPTFASVAPASPPLAEQVSPQRALATLPADAGRVVSVVERRNDRGLTQTITLAGDGGAQGDDHIVVTSRDRDGTLERRHGVDEATIEAELAEALPGVAMTMSPRVHTAGATLPLGLATGRAAGGFTCLYGWSQAEARRRSASGRSTFALFAGDDAADLSLRLRLCRRGLSEERLIALAEGLTLRTDVMPRSDAWMPGRPTGRDALESAGYGGTVAAAPASSMPVWSRPVAVVEPPPRAPAPARHAAPRPTRPAVAAPARPDPAIPPIPTTSDAAARAPAPSAPTTTPTPASTAGASFVPLPSGG